MADDGGKRWAWVADSNSSTEWGSAENASGRSPSDAQHLLRRRELEPLGVEVQPVLLWSDERHGELADAATATVRSSPPRAGRDRSRRARRPSHSRRSNPTGRANRTPTRGRSRSDRSTEITSLICAVPSSTSIRWRCSDRAAGAGDVVDDPCHRPAAAARPRPPRRRGDRVRRRATQPPASSPATPPAGRRCRSAHATARGPATRSSRRRRRCRRR